MKNNPDFKSKESILFGKKTKQNNNNKGNAIVMYYMGERGRADQKYFHSTILLLTMSGQSELLSIYG